MGGSTDASVRHNCDFQVWSGGKLLRDHVRHTTKSDS
jgi:hypothetical protein